MNKDREADLRAQVHNGDPTDRFRWLGRELFAEIDALQSEVTRLRDALENISFQENLYINEDEHRAFLICKKLADEALKLMPVRIDLG